MEEIFKKARAKINLNLLVLNKREDNYHNIKSVFQKVNLYDEIYIRKTQNEDIEIKSNIEELNNEENIIVKAYRKLKQNYPQITGVNIYLKKNIPMQAGLGGGSTDCATFLLAMNKLFNLKLSEEEIKKIGRSLGADVVPCIYKNPVLAEGIGDEITKLNCGFKYYILIIKPNLACNTKEMYGNIDSQTELKQPDNYDKIIQALEEKDIKLLADNLYNRFESALGEKQDILILKGILEKSGAKKALMTGSGSCVYGIFENKQIAKKAYQELKEKYKIYICTSYCTNKEEIFD